MAMNYGYYGSESNPNNPDIQNMDDVRWMVDDFYGKVRKDELIGPIFEEVLHDHWDEHLEKMYCFWQTVLFDDEPTYSGRPLIPHLGLPVSRPHFNRWLTLFFATVNSRFHGIRADHAKRQGDRMATIFQIKIAEFA